MTADSIFPNTSAEQADVICRRLRSILEDHTFDTAGMKLKIGFGVTELTPNPDEPAPRLLEKAVDTLEQNAP